MSNKSFLAFALLHISVPAISVTFWDASPLWLIGGLIFAAATIRTLHVKSSAFVATILCFLSGVAFSLTLMLGTCYYMSGEGFNDSFFYHLNSGSLVIAARSYGSVFYPSLLGLILAFLAPAIIYKTQSIRVWPEIPVVLLWVLALVGNYPVYSLVNYQMGIDAEQSGVTYPKLTKEQPVTDLPRQETGKQAPGVSKQANSPIAIREIQPSVVKDPNKILPTELIPENEPQHTPQLPEVPVVLKAKPETKAKAKPEPVPRKNIILIYAESLEALYFETAIFGDLVPGIRKLSENAHQFTNLVQVGGTGWTIAGIVASQCGFPLKVSNHLASNSTMSSVEKPYPDEICLADILSENAYTTSFMGGAPLWFAGKGNFLRTHGYQRIFGDIELAPLLPDKKYQSDWGVYDDSLFELALKELQSLEKETNPYLLTLLTLDTHHPYGIPSKSCKKLADNEDEMSNAIYCSDQLISNFINNTMKIVDMSDTIIVLFSDHLSLRNTLWDKLKDNRKRRRLTFMIFDDKPATVSDVHATHFNVAPTVLEAAGFTDKPKVGVGVSLFARSPQEQSGRKAAQIKEKTPHLLNPAASFKDSGISLSRRDLSLRVGDLTLKANDSGQKFVYGMYLVAINKQGNVVDAFYSDDYESLAQNLNGTFVVGISVAQAPPYSAVYFYGKLSPDGKGMTQREFYYDIHLNAADIWPSPARK